MDRLIQQLTQNQVSSLDQLIDLQKKFEALDVNVLSSTTPQDPLETLDASRHSLAYLSILNARLSSNDRSCLTHAATFADMCEYTQVKQSRSGLERFGNQLAAFADRLNSPGLVVRILYPLCIHLRSSYTATLAHRDQQDPVALTVDSPLYIMTPLHSILLKYMMTSHFQELGLTGLDGCVSIADSVSPSAREFLLFEYYSALRHIGLRNYQKAVEHCSACLIIPSTVTSAIQISAFKKLCLLTLLLTGKSYKTPKYVAAPLQRTCRNLAEPYMNIMQAFSTLEAQKLQTAIEENRELLQSDGNLGLANNLTNSLTRRLIRDLTKTYQTLSLADITRMVGLAPENVSRVESMLVDMIDMGQISASISHAQNGMVTFLNSEQRFDTMESLCLISKEYEELSSIISRVHSISDEIGLSQEYLKTYPVERLTSPTLTAPTHTSA